MKFPVFHIVFCCIFTLQLTAQQNHTFRGKVLYMSSGKKAAVGVEVSGTIKDISSANPVYTTDDGDFQLIFPEAVIGRRVHLTIGKTDSEGQEIELVNQRAINSVRIPAIATHEFEIVIAKKGERDSMAQKYYGIFKTSAQRELDKILKKIASLETQHNKDYEKIQTLRNQYAKLERQNDSISIYREAYRLASINRDNASERVKKYLDLLDEGKSIQEAREELSVAAAAEELHESVSKFYDAVEELEYNAYASESFFDSEDAIDAYGKIIAALENMEIDRATKATYYAKIADVYLKNGNYEFALDYQQKVLDSLDRILDSRDSYWATAYNGIGIIYLALKQADSARSYHKKAIDIQKKILNSSHHDLATSYDYMALAYQGLGRYKKALNYHKRAIRIREAILNTQHPDLATAYYHTALTHQARGSYKKALEYHRKAIAIREVILNTEHPDLGLNYMNLGITYAVMEDFRTALPLLEKSRTIFKESLRERHPYTKKVLSTLGITYTRNKQFKEAEATFSDYEKRAPKEGETYRNWAVYYALQNDREKALEQLQKAVEVGFDDIKWLKTDDSMKNLRGERGFKKLMKKIKKKQ